MWYGVFWAGQTQSICQGELEERSDTGEIWKYGGYMIVIAGVVGLS